MGQSWLLLFILDGLSSQFKNIDDVLGDWTRGFKMVGAKGSTEPWWLSQSKIILLRLLLFEWWQDLTILKRCLFIYIMQRQLVVSNCLNCQNEFVVAHSYEREHIPAAKINSAPIKSSVLQRKLFTAFWGLNFVTKFWYELGTNKYAPSVILVKCRILIPASQHRRSIDK